MCGPDSNDNMFFHMKQTPASAPAREALKFSVDADAMGPATLRVLSISVYAVRTSKSGLAQNKRTAGKILPEVGNSIALPHSFPYKSKSCPPRSAAGTGLPLRNELLLKENKFFKIRLKSSNLSPESRLFATEHKRRIT